MARIPTTKEVFPGARVNIVLKADQPTGRTVSGTVRDVLTRGNHPRGIKVRLGDGRIGRVQSLTAAVDFVPANSDAEVPEAGDGATSSSGTISYGARQSRAVVHTDQSLPSQQIGLDAFVKPAKQRGRGKARAPTSNSGEDGGTRTSKVVSSATEIMSVAKCPVCDAFEGDEAAVAHHVASHFDG